MSTKSTALFNPLNYLNPWFDWIDPLDKRQQESDALERYTSLVKTARYLNFEARAFETDTGYRLEFDVPGVPKDKLVFKQSGRTFTLTVDAVDTPEKEPVVGYRRSPRTLTLTVPKAVQDADEAVLVNGVLTVTVPFRPAKSNVRAVKIR